MKKILFTFVFSFVVSIYLFSIDTKFHSAGIKTQISQICFCISTQSVTIDKIEKNDYLELGMMLSSAQIFPFSDKSVFNFFMKENFAYFFHTNINLEESVSDFESSGWYFGTTIGTSVFLPQSINELEIMIGLGYHSDCTIGSITDEEGILRSSVFDFSLVGIGANCIIEYKLSEKIGINMGIDFSVDFWGLSAGKDILETSNYITNPAVNFDVGMGISFPYNIFKND